ncbi:hypothetical protein GCM10009720_18620 [Yaniella flava]|uniref:Uncharacterized protein n=1 Tax=Yaniella flava TaxID=287930 RepID=A0ABP5G3M4_9MICC
MHPAPDPCNDAFATSHRKSHNDDVRVICALLGLVVVQIRGLSAASHLNNHGIDIAGNAAGVRHTVPCPTIKGPAVVLIVEVTDLKSHHTGLRIRDGGDSALR